MKSNYSASEKSLRGTRRVDHTLPLCVLTVSEMMTQPYLCVCVCVCETAAAHNY